MNTLSMAQPEAGGPGARSNQNGNDRDTKYLWTRKIDPVAAQRSELMLDLLNFADLQRELNEGLERQRRERQREAGLLAVLEERHRRAAEARDACRLELDGYVADGAPDDGAPDDGAPDDGRLRMLQGTLGRLCAEASLNLLELNTYRNRTHQLGERITLIEDRLAVIDAEMAARRARLDALALEGSTDPQLVSSSR